MTQIDELEQITTGLYASLRTQLQTVPSLQKMPVRGYDSPDLKDEQDELIGKIINIRSVIEQLSHITPFLGLITAYESLMKQIGGLQEYEKYILRCETGLQVALGAVSPIVFQTEPQMSAEEVIASIDRGLDPKTIGQLSGRLAASKDYAGALNVLEYVHGIV